MSVRIRPFNKADLEKMCDEVTTVAYNKSDEQIKPTTVSARIFGADEESKQERGIYEDQSYYNKRGYITFKLPVVNPFLAGSNYSVLRKILGMDADRIRAIAEGSIVFDTQEDKEIVIRGSSAESDAVDNSRQSYERERHLIGGEYVEKLINDFDVEAAICDMIVVTLTKAVETMYDNSKIVFHAEDIECFEHEVSQEQYVHVIDEYYLEKSVLNSSIYKVPEIIESVRDLLLQDFQRRFELLLGIKRQGKNVVSDQVMYYLPVMPLGYRPSPVNSKKKDPITLQYNAVIRCDNKIREQMIYTGTTLYNIGTAYRELVRNVKELMVGGVDQLHTYDMQYNSILDTMIGKDGTIRERMEGVRIDYSGRSVIIVDPNMSVDTIGIPKRIAERLVSISIMKACVKKHAEVDTYLQKPRAEREELAAAYIKGKYVIAGRQPTLFYLGIKAFIAEPVDGNAIVLNPLCTPSFNADFDGDQMHAEVPLRIASEEEVTSLMASTENLFLPRNGECHIAPRQEILHGLWKASVCEFNSDEIVATYPDSESSYEEVYKKVCMQEYDISDKIAIGLSVKTAGKFAVKYALGFDTYGAYRLGVWPLERGSEDKAVTEGWFKDLLRYMVLQQVKEGNGNRVSKQVFVTAVNRLTRLGHAVANIIPPSVSILNDFSIEDNIQQFDKTIREREELFNIGLETEQAFTAFYDKEYAKLEKEAKTRLQKELPEDNGYIEMMLSGARGSMSNIMQLFGMKGRVKKNSTESFNAILKTPLKKQLNGLEHFVTAYGSREGIKEKTISTYKPGYLYRKSRYATNGMSIVSNDCGTQNGLLLDFYLLQHFISGEEMENPNAHPPLIIKQKIVEYLKFLKGRYVVGENDIIKTDHQISKLYDKYIGSEENGKFKALAGLKLRSPITCENPCCVKCYGVDLATDCMAVKGTPIGYIASQAMSEPGTQLTMKKFQTGGVVGKSDLTSSFDEMEKYMNLDDLKPAVSRQPITYDFITPVAGLVHTTSMGNGTKRLHIRRWNEKGKLVNVLKQRILVHEDVELKSYVKVGDSIQKHQGNLSIPECIEVRGVDFAQRYLTLKLYNIYVNNIYVDLKHFEVLVASMTMYQCIKSNNYFKTGLYYTLQQYWSHDRNGSLFAKRLKSVKGTTFDRSDMLSGVFLESVANNIDTGIITSGQDELNDPETRIALGLKLNIGSAVEGYKDKRGTIHV